MSETEWFDLKPNRDLMDFNFDGYKLSLDSLPQYKIELQQPTYNLIDISPNQQSKRIENKIKTDIDTQKPYLYQHIKLYNMHNHLFYNEFENENDRVSLYYFDTNWTLMKILILNQTNERNVIQTNLSIEKPINLYNERVSITMIFLSKRLAIICDGCSTLYLCEYDIDSNECWKVLYSHQLENIECQKSVLYDACFIHKPNDLIQISCVLMNIIEKYTEKSIIKYETMINWLQFESISMKNEWNLLRIRKFNCFRTVPDYVCVSRDINDEYLLIAGSSLIEFVEDNGKKIEVKHDDKQTEIKNTNEQKNENNTETFYEWSQSNNDLNIIVLLNEKNIIKNDLIVNLNENSLEIFYKNILILKENFKYKIIFDESTWTVNTTHGKLEFIVQKKDAFKWDFLFESSDLKGKYKETNTNTTDQFSLNTDGSGLNATYFKLNQQLEECDGILSGTNGKQDEQQIENGASFELSNNENLNDNDYYMLLCFNGITNSFKYKSCINTNKYLFNLSKYSNKIPALCLRYDVDGILWQPNFQNHDQYFTHDHTFYAFGYVHASKQNAKFTLAPYSCSYACICDTSKHVYIYKQKSEKVESNLRNRKSGIVITHVSKQYVVSLDTDMEIMGAFCTNEFIVLLLENVIYFIRVTVQ